MNIARCPQGHPVIIQAGGSPSGLELAARTADVVFASGTYRKGLSRESFLCHPSKEASPCRIPGTGTRDARFFREPTKVTAGDDP
jgi:hypothetical protein